MLEELKKIKHSTLSKTLFFLSVEVSIFWILGNWINVYQFALTGAIYEILWLPNLVMLFTLPLVILFFLGKEKKKLQSLYLYSIILLTIAILTMLKNQ